MEKKSEESAQQTRIIDLKAGAHMMVLDAGVFCIFHTLGQQPPGPAGLPGVRISKAPGTPPGIVSVSTFEEDGWIGGINGAALVRVLRGPAAILVTTYQEPDSTHEAPKLQVAQLAGPAVAPSQPASSQSSGEVVSAEDIEISAHIQRLGDVGGVIGKWMGEPGSQAWIEGFSIESKNSVPSEDIEYQAVLGKGWLSPWAEGGQYCGSRGMALPILGLRVRLKGEAEKTHKIRLTASFTDGTRLGPVDGSEALEAESLAPLEAFLLEVVDQSEAGETTKTTKKPARSKTTKTTTKRKAAE
ncbi:hypothetical protein [Swingsia samuiensis]|uniref:Clostridial hydrophobic W n=1 Tax=Swingsia samuiensis TaxID=1293412 RepID=A0A4Y6UHP5_9PROT|nr:hypothetical protein [Swingsia samuiensis]QDH17119.1 hypothetical protein E3D00_05730 [Swingsia samuiensis]